MVGISTLFNLNGQVTIVTGGAGLLGSEFCKTLAGAGARVFVADINREAAESTAASINAWLNKPGAESAGGEAFAIEVDVSSRDSVFKGVDTVLEMFDRLDILVNSAAIDPKYEPESVAEVKGEKRQEGDRGAAGKTPQPVNSFDFTFEDYPLELWNNALDVNLTGSFLCCQAAARPMLAQGKGTIINICSIYGLVGPDQRIYQQPDKPGLFKPVQYSVTKAGILGLTRYLATYFAGKGIRVNALTPGGVFNGQGNAFVDAYSARTLLGRMAEKNEMNGALLFLVSDASAYMTGANLVVDGGWTAW
jgi:NAD(P)-dependent dehydrogenase (short-subunit alcohol dehydrogenase family)